MVRTNAIRALDSLSFSQVLREPARSLRRVILIHVPYCDRSTQVSQEPPYEAFLIDNRSSRLNGLLRVGELGRVNAPRGSPLHHRRTRRCH